MTAQSRKRRGRARRRKTVKRLILTAMVLIPILIVAVAFAIIKYKPTDEKYDLNAYYNLADSRVALVVGDQILEAHGQMIENRMYVPYRVLHDSVDDRYYWDSSLQALLYTTGTEVLSYPLGEDVRMVSADGQGEVLYVAFELIQQHTPMISQVFTESPMRIVMEVEEKPVTAATVKSDTVVRYRGGVKSPILAEVSADEDVRVLEHGDNWTKVMTADGFAGYIQKNKLGADHSMTPDLQHPLGEEDGLTPTLRDHKIRLVWHQVTAKSQNDKLYEALAATAGVNVVSPTWFNIADASGTITSRASQEYVDHVHSKGMEVWGLVDNFTVQNLPIYEILSNASTRARMISQLMEYADSLDLDGINVDFEDLTEEVGESFVQFIRELGLACDQHKLILSVDNHVPYNFNAFYNLSEQAAFADYIIMMSYDEFLNDRTGAGTTASIDYVKGALERTMEQDVPAAQLINAVPFYTRIWKEVPDNGSVKLNWETVGMVNAWTQMTEAGATPQWDDQLKQYYAEYAEGDKTCKVWLEETDSLRARLEVMKSLDVAGVAGWKLGLEDPKVWAVMDEYYPAQ